jgi:hypothetical protein
MAGGMCQSPVLSDLCVTRGIEQHVSPAPAWTV